MWGKYCRIYPEFAPPPKKNPQTTALFKGTTNIRKLSVCCLIAQEKMKSRIYKIKCTSAQPKIVILNNISHSVTSKVNFVFIKFYFLRSDIQDQ